MAFILPRRRPHEQFLVPGVVVLTDGKRTDGQLRLEQIVKLTDANERPITNYQEGQSKAGLHAPGLAQPTKYKIHVFPIGIGGQDDVDWEAPRLMAEATSSVLSRSTENDLSSVLERFGRYF